MNVRMMIIAAPLVLLATPALAGEVSERQTAMGTILADAAGMTLYMFDKDELGKSNCAGPCADNWPPAMVAAGDMAKGYYGIITRADGAKQWAYMGKPLYRWAKDAKPGDTTGDGVNGVWHAAKPTAAMHGEQAPSPMKSGY